MNTPKRVGISGQSVIPVLLSSSPRDSGVSVCLGSQGCTALIQRDDRSPDIVANLQQADTMIGHAASVCCTAWVEE